ncbi:MAG: glycine hydroxymethyltransferase, partial [Proteobacteria bacterium]|nr:glycine hydroxymethyltransferase [Pseudomonadota bacterium]
GLRIGVQEMTRMGMKESEMGEIAQLMGAVMKGEYVLQQVGRLREQFTDVQFC